MDISHILNPLNDKQRQAATAEAYNLLVLAGAGTGKTRVLVHRIAWLIATEGLSPHEILAVTFTNKAANEMRIRIEELLQRPIGGMWVGTFHGLAHRLLREHWQEAGLPEKFQILDADDQYRLIKRVHKSLGLDESKWPAKTMSMGSLTPKKMKAYGRAVLRLMVLNIPQICLRFMKPTNKPVPEAGWLILENYCYALMSYG